MGNWNLRDEFLRAIDHWYLIFGFIVFGGLLGFGISSVYPAPYRASADLYVGINITRVNEMQYLIPLAKTEPLNLDDYKNWQLKQLADIFYSDIVLEDALTNLKKETPEWESLSLADFRKNLDIYWYDTGIWRLNYIASNRDMAEMAAYAWLDAGYRYVSDLLEISEQASDLDADLEINKDASSDLKIQKARLASFQESSQEWLNTLSSLESRSPLSEEMLTELESWILSYRRESAVWHIPMGDYPGQGAPASSYLTWLENARLQAAIAGDTIQLQLNELAEERERLLPDYHQSLDESLGLSANLVLQENSSTAEVSRVREPGVVTLAGAALGFLSWLIFTFLGIRGAHED
jgi:hypothetical protein